MFSASLATISAHTSAILHQDYSARSCKSAVWFTCTHQLQRASFHNLGARHDFSIGCVTASLSRSLFFWPTSSSALILCNVSEMSYWAAPPTRTLCLFSLWYNGGTRGLHAVVLTFWTQRLNIRGKKWLTIGRKRVCYEIRMLMTSLDTWNHAGCVSKTAANVNKRRYSVSLFFFTTVQPQFLHQNESALPSRMLVCPFERLL